MLQLSKRGKSLVDMCKLFDAPRLNFIRVDVGGCHKSRSKSGEVGDTPIIENKATTCTSIKGVLPKTLPNH
jgi:hypothetical protein